MKSLHKLNCCLLLLATSLCKTTTAQVIPIEPSPPDVLLSTLPPSPAFPFPPPVVDVQRTYDELLQQAREVARAEFEEERAQWRTLREGGGGDEGRKDQEMKVVRETFYLPVPKQEVSPSAADATGEEKAATPAVASAVVKPLEEAADIVKTVGKLKSLKPVFKYAIHHPLRFLYRYALVPLFHLLLFLLSNIFSFLLYLLSTALSPLQLVLSVLLAPLFSLYRLNLALLPLYYTLIGALLAGSALGVIAGLVAGRTTREVIDEAVWRTKKSLIWVGVLPKEPTREEKKAPGGYGPGARLETLAGVFGSSRARAQEAEKEKKRRSKGKERAFASPLTDDGDEDGLATPPGHFNPIHLSSSSNRRPVAVLASESNPFPSHISTSLAQRRHEEKAYPPPPRYAKPEEAEDPPSEELPLTAAARSNPAGVRAGADGRMSAKAKVMATASGEARGWREREVDF